MAERPSLADLCTRLGLDETAELPPERPRLPWYAEALPAVGAWIAAMALIGAAISLLKLILIDPDRWSALQLSLIGLAAALGLRAAGDAPFTRQLALALGLAGLAGAGASFLDMGDDEFIVAAPITLALTLLTAPLMRDAVYGFMGGVASCGLLLGLIAEDFGMGLAAAAPFALLTLPVALALLLRPWRVGHLRPVGYAFALAAPVLLALHSQLNEALGVPDPGARAVYLIGGLFLLAMLVRPLPPGRRAPWLLAGAAVVAAAVLVSAGLAAALGLLLLAALLGNRGLAAVALLLHGVALVRLYYQLETTLMTKSALLAAAGLVLLAVWWLLERRPLYQEGERDAPTPA